MNKKFALGILALGAWHLFAVSVPAAESEDQCPEAVQAAGSPVFGPSEEQSDLPRFARAVSTLIGKTGYLPDIHSLAVALKTSEGTVEEFFATADAPSDMIKLVGKARELFPAPFEALKKKLLTKASTYFKDHLTLPTTATLAQLAGCSDVELEIIYGNLDAKNLLVDLKATHSKAFEVVRNKVIRAYTKASKNLGRTATISEIADVLEVNSEVANGLVGADGVFESFSQIKEEAYAESPGSFASVIDTDIFNQQRTDALVEAIKKRKRLILTTAVAGAAVNQEFFGALLNYCRLMDAEVIVYPANMQTTGLDPILLDTPGVHILTHTIELSDELRLDNIKQMAKILWPLSGLDRMGSRRQSFVIGAPKMHVQTIPTIDNSYSPYKKLSTGAITEGNYSGRHFISKRTDRIATHDHILAAYILEKNSGGAVDLGVPTSGRFHGRHVEYIPSQAGFLDLGVFYTASSTTDVRPEALALGDIHVGHTDQKLIDSVVRQLLALRPKRVILHDLLNGHSISHHEKFDLVALGRRVQAGNSNLEQEIHKVINFVNALLTADRDITIVIVPSNHDYWLHRWLKSGQFTQEPENLHFGAELFQAYLRGIDPFKYALMGRGVEHHQIEYPKRVVFLEIGQSYKVGPQEDRNRLVELGQHGDFGANGGRGGLRTLQRAADGIVFGHTHTYARFNRAVNIGTLTRLVLPYNKSGASSWVQSSAVIGPNGEIQVLEFKDGEWFTDPNQQELSQENFFQEGFPLVAPNNDDYPSSEGGQIDQWSW